MRNIFSQNFYDCQTVKDVVLYDAFDTHLFCDTPDKINLISAIHTHMLNALYPVERITYWTNTFYYDSATDKVMHTDYFIFNEVKLLQSDNINFIHHLKYLKND